MNSNKKFCCFRFSAFDIENVRCCSNSNNFGTSSICWSRVERSPKFAVELEFSGDFHIEIFRRVEKKSSELNLKFSRKIVAKVVAEIPVDGEQFSRER